MLEGEVLFEDVVSGIMASVVGSGVVVCGAVVEDVVARSVICVVDATVVSVVVLISGTVVAVVAAGWVVCVVETMLVLGVVVVTGANVDCAVIEVVFVTAGVVGDGPNLKERWQIYVLGEQDPNPIPSDGVQKPH